MKRCHGLILGAVLALAGGAAAADTYVPGGDNDPRVRASEFLAGNGRYLSASALLGRIPIEEPKQTLAPAYYRELANDTLSFGLPHAPRRLTANRSPMPRIPPR